MGSEGQLQSKVIRHRIEFVPWLLGFARWKEWTADAEGNWPTNQRSGRWLWRGFACREVCWYENGKRTHSYGI